MTSSAFRIALVSTLLLLALAASEWLDPAMNAGPAVLSGAPSATIKKSPAPSFAVVAPVRRVMPRTPPLPEAILAAGDVEEPSRAPDQAPLPERRDAALARSYTSANADAVLEVPVPRRVALGRADTVGARVSVD